MSVSSVTATQPEPKSNNKGNLTHPALRLPVHSDNDLSFSSLSDAPPPWQMDVYLSDYGFLFPPLIFGEATEHLYTDKQYPNNSCKNSCSWSPSKPAGDIRTCTGTYTHMHVQTHLCSLPCFDRRCRCLGPTGDIMVVGKMCGVTMALVCNLLFCLCLTDRDFHRTRQRSL